MKDYRNYRNYRISGLETEFLSDNIEDSDKVFELKDKIRKLNQTDKTLLLLYLAEESYAKVAKKIGVSATTVFNNIRRIKKNILND